MNSQDYWRKREEKWIKQQIKEDAKQSKIIAEKYQKALDQIGKEISANWERFAGKEGVTLSDAKKMALEMDVKAFARKAKEYVDTKDFSKTANDELRLYNVTMRVNRLELLKSQIGLELIALSDDIDKYTADTLTKTGIKEAERQAGILGETVFSNYKTFVESVAFGSFQGATFSERIWGNNGALKADLDRLLIRGITQGKNPRDLARELRNLFGSSRYEAERLMRTETARMQLEIQKQSYKEYGIEEYEYIAEPSACDLCRPLDSKIFKTSKMVIGLNAPPMHPNCRCSTTPAVGRGVESERGISGSGRVGTNDVDLEYIDSKDFRSKFNQLTENTRVNDQLRRYAQAMLTHRNGTDGEDLYLINASTGELIKRKFGGNDELGVSLTKNESDELRKYRGNLIGIHNHPTNVWPTGSDYAVSGYRGYKMGIVATHDGRVFKYSAGEKSFLPYVFDQTVAKYMAVPYNLSIEKAFMKTVSQFRREYGISCEEI